MDSLPSQSSGRFNLESATSSSAASSSSSSPRRENNTQGRRNSSSLNTSSSSKSLFEHNLSSILNNPTRSSDTSWIGWWHSSSSTSVVLPEFAPINTFKPELETSRSDFVPYLSLVSESFRRFEDIRNHTSKENVEAGVDSIGGQGEALVACLREVPALFFKEDFQLEERGTFKAACPFASLSENLLLQERLSQYLDVVEVHLVKEISLRSNSFFEAQRQLEDLNVKVVEGCKRIRELKETIRLLDVDLVDSARRVQELNGSRNNLLSIQQKLRLMLYVNQALSALKLLVTSGDCAGALDVADDLQHLLDGGELTGLHCFRHLRDHVASATDSVNSILSAEFMRESTLYNGEVDNAILLRAKEGASTFFDGRADEVKLDDVETSNMQDHLLPIIIGLLRTAKLPSVLRMYNETLTTEMKIAIKTAVAELLPILLVRPLDSDFSGDRTTDADGGGGSTLASKLRSLSSESFVQLLLAIFKIVLSHLMRAAEVKKSIEWIMSNLDGHYAAASVARAIEHGAIATEVAQLSEAEADDIHPHPLQRIANSTTPLLGNGNIATSSSTNISKNFRADVLRENAEALFAACDAAHGRWAKLLGVRALLHPRLKLQEFLSMYNITQEFMTATEKIGGRVGYTIRGVLQSQAKSFIEFQHESRMAKMKAVLDQETWVEVEVPDEFQAIVSSIHDSDPLVTENTDDSQASITEGDGVLGNSVATVGEGNGHQHVEHRDSNEVHSDNSTHMKSHQLSEASKNNQGDSMTAIVSSNNSNTKDREKSTPHTLLYQGASYHMVNCGLILIKMLSEYIDMNDNLPLHSMEIVRRVVDILKFFNTRTCQLVLGAGAMQVSGLKSITAKHLALASQVISFTFALIPDVRRILFLKVSDARKGLLSSDIDRVAQDYKIHRDEIHTKLVQIMRERLLVHLRGLSQIVESWNRPDDSDTQPSQFARSLTKEVAFLQRVLSRTLHEADVQAIFRQVVIIFHTQITDAFSRFEISTPQAKNRLRRELDHLLACIRSLPSDIASKSGVANWGPLDDFFAQRFGDEDGQ